MNKQEAEKTIVEYTRPVFGFALKRCKSLQDAEDLSQEIARKAFESLCARDDIEDAGKFIWTIAHHALSNYYRDHPHQWIGAPLDEAGQALCDDADIAEQLATMETVEKLRNEIAYLSKLQRRIVIAYYYENKKQSDIARELGLSSGTVKWHLFEAKKDLKRGMQIMRTPGELKFNPIRFGLCGTNGSIGSKGDNSNFFRSALSQNIEYAVWKKPKTINEIAGDLGVSPVYVESEAEYLAQYGFLTKHGETYLCNILLDEPTPELNQLHDEVYEKAAKLFANECYDALMASDIWSNPNITGGCTQELSLTQEYSRDKNFFLWALIPYIAALSGESMMETAVSFDQAATLRPDGGHNICYASILDAGTPAPKYFDSMLRWSGPCWNQMEGLTLWQIDSEWSARRVDDTYSLKIQRMQPLLLRHRKGELLSSEEYADLAAHGFLKTIGRVDGAFKAAYQCVVIEGTQAKRSLLAVGDRIKEKHREEFDALRKSLADAVLRQTPRQLHTMCQYGLQFLFYSDGWFILHCMKELVNSGKLALPAEHQKQALTTLLIHE